MRNCHLCSSRLQFCSTGIYQDARRLYLLTWVVGLAGKWRSDKNVTDYTVLCVGSCYTQYGYTANHCACIYLIIYNV